VALALPLLRRLTTAPPKEAWAALFDEAWRVCSPPLPGRNTRAEISRRDGELAALDLFLATSGWDLWAAYEGAAVRTSTALVEWWAAQLGGRAVLILDGLSLREAPWIVHGATPRGFKIHEARVTGSELPAETTPFAKALGLAQRSSLENNGAGSAFRLQGARTETGDLPWAESEKLVGTEPRWVFWHHWPDVRIHDLSGPGQGLDALAADVAARLNDDAFWSFVERLATGRRLIITSDHGYAASGLFSDASDDQSRYLRAAFQSGRSAFGEGESSAWIPPVTLALASVHGVYRYALGRRKWRSQGGYPTLTHGGLSILEVASPFIEISGRE
jgi:hypothetical protein